jgi:hypothetical protein
MNRVVLEDWQSRPYQRCPHTNGVVTYRRLPIFEERSGHLHTHLHELSCIPPRLRDSGESVDRLECPRLSSVIGEQGVPETPEACCETTGAKSFAMTLYAGNRREGERYDNNQHGFKHIFGKLGPLTDWELAEIARSRSASFV